VLAMKRFSGGQRKALPSGQALSTSAGGSGGSVWRTAALHNGPALVCAHCDALMCRVLEPYLHLRQAHKQHQRQWQQAGEGTCASWATVTMRIAHAGLELLKRSSRVACAAT
jgi:hypothetical protein